jgi:ribose-phosphate pyrophosphokinase
MKENSFSVKGDLAVMTCNANPALARKIAAILGEDLFLSTEIGSFRDKECRIISVDDTRGRDVYLIQSTGQPDRNLVEIELLVGAIRRSARKITVLIPYFGYSRMDRRGESRQPISINSMMRRLVGTGIDGLVFFHLHNPVTAGIPEAIDPHIKVDHLNARPIILEYLQSRNLKKMTIASADVGGAAFARSCWERLHAIEPEVGFGLAYKVGSSSTGIEKVNLFGDYRGKEVVFIDDMTTSGDTIIKAGQAAKGEEPESIEAILIHPVLADELVCQNLIGSPIDRFVMTESLAIPARYQEILAGKLAVISPDKLLALAIWHLHTDQSMTQLFELKGYLESYAAMQQKLAELAKPKV